MSQSLNVEPIGFVRTGHEMKFQAGHQPDPKAIERNVIELLPGKQFELAVEDLEGFDRIWLVWWFDKNTTWRPRAMPPRGPAKRRGVFATRSPHRPNPIGLTCVDLVKVEGLNLVVGPLDLLDGTPVLDIKPYLTTVDCFPDSSLGWVAEVENLLSQPPPYDVQLSEKAKAQLEWLKSEWKVDFWERAQSILGYDPTHHRTRRILQIPDGRMRLGFGPWRIYYNIDEQRVTVDEIRQGYTLDKLERFDEIPHRDALRAFVDRWESE